MHSGEPPAAPASPTLVPHKGCTSPDFRREWRTLSKDEKVNYIDAVNCLARTPGVLKNNCTLHDDFSWVHNRVAHATHGKAAFFSWHRRFISVYERYLQGKCGYRGSLPYWDWTLDWEDLPNSPIFSKKTGFGGNVDPESPITVGGGRCVVDGPFSHLKLQYYGSHRRPHCLSRGFSDFPGRNASPAVVENVLASEDYETFFLATENGPHNVAPLGIKGDIDSFTAPNDPIFYLHHAQLDRLWFLWQMRRPKVRLGEYQGRAQPNGLASLDEILSMEGLAKDVKVSEVMDTQDNELCYRYSLS
ncbi:Tyrosinase [Tolypocladium ophioglossoides CBS 100239]|uniref:Tyrosinase n=1 Tax=Tolypocladium ophioglossoides (strain CBS 100239) TaxID=1163406 RepID=A0A0L0NB41_TOLOC|nr:Tyrosinase [Tolypocladium ophioglossoides CBS 100239]